MHSRHSIYRRHLRWLRHIPRRKHLRGTWLHRWLGERLFAPELWRPTRHEVAAGLGLGVFIGLTPTMGVQLYLSGILAYLLRVNIPMALAGALITNPLTAPVIYPLLFKLGVWMIGMPEPAEGYTGVFRNFARYAKPLWAGSLAAGGVFSAVVYGAVMLLWAEARQLQKFIHRPERRRAAKDKACPSESGDLRAGGGPPRAE